MKEKKMFGKGEKRLAECFSLSVWVTRFQPTDNGYIGLFWGERGKKGGREEEKYDGKKERGKVVGVGDCARGRLLSSESRWIVSIHRRLAVLSTVESSL